MHLSKKLTPLILVSAYLCGCSHLYYKSWEALGKEKRDLLASNVEELGDDQEDSKEEFQDTLEKIRSEYKFSEGSLESTYDEMKDDYEDLEENVKDLKGQLAKVESIAGDLFEEWEDEASELKNSSYRKTSLSKLISTKKSFHKMTKAAHQTEKSMDKTLARFHEQVIFLKHNLNAKVIGNLTEEVKILEGEMKKLIGEIETSIQQSKAFLGNLNT